MGTFQGRLVRYRDKADDRIMFVLSAETRLRMWKIDSSAKKQIEYAAPTEVEVLPPSRVDVGDALSILTTRGVTHRTDDIGLSFKAGDTRFIPFQFRPLMSYLNGKRKRILIADEPGLGKTISSSYIMVEEMARSPMNRVLILCPPRLRMKWKRELYRRFGLNFQILGGRALLRNIERQRLRCIASLDSMGGRIPSLVLALSDSPRLDFLLID